MKPILVVPLIGPSITEVKDQYEKAEVLGLKTELRLDLIKEDVSSLKICPWIVTHGLSKDKIDLFDSEFIDVDFSCFEGIKEKASKKIIASYHNFKETPHNLEELFFDIKKKAKGAYLYKIATYANSTLDALRMLLFVQKMHSHGERLLGICMGTKGSVTRILSPVIQNPFTFAPLDSAYASAQGQLTVDELRDIYFFDHLTPHTKIFALIGDPVDKSRGHVIHNRYFKSKDCNAVYIKLQINKEELESFLNFAIELQISGMAVTMPLKEEITKYIEVKCLEPSINTLILKRGSYKGYNLDVVAASELIKSKTSLSNKSVYILGAGGVGGALAYHLKNEGAIVTLFNRSQEKGQMVASKAHAKFSHYDGFDGHCDILIQTTSVGMTPVCDESIIDTNKINSSTLVIDFVSNPKETKFLRGAKAKGCVTIDGDLLLERVSFLQQQIWNVSSHNCCQC